jgi:hypothetical protein
LYSGFTESVFCICLIIITYVWVWDECSLMGILVVSWIIELVFCTFVKGNAVQTVVDIRGFFMFRTSYSCI